MKPAASTLPCDAMPRPSRYGGALLAATGRPDLAPAERRWLIAGITVLHLLGLWGLLQGGVVRQAVHRVAPLMVDFISAEAPPKPAPPPQQVRRVQALRPAPLPAVVAAPTPQVPPAPPTVAVPEPVPQPVQAAPAPASPPAPITTPALAQPTTPKPVAASALRYAVLPPVELPLASRRLGESGTVLLRVVFDTQGRVRQAGVHRSSGFARLDEQALAAMRQARIVPFVDQGQPIEVSAIAPLAYELD